MKKCLTYILAALASVFSVSALANGWLDQSSTYDRYVGWACFPGSSQPVGVHIYVGGTYIGGGNAALYREDAVRIACGSTTSNHGFDIRVTAPANLRDGKTRAVTVYAIYANGSSAQIGNTPMNLVFKADSTRPQTLGDIVGRDLAYSWGGPLNYFGHIGIWDGINVIEAVGSSSADDTLKMTSWESFSNGATLWQPITPAQLDYKQRYCHISECIQNISAGGDVSLTADYTRINTMLVKAATLAYVIGAKYTRTAGFIPVRQGVTTHTQICNPFNGQCTTQTSIVKPTKGMYRCETFIVNIFGNTGSRNSLKLIGLQPNESTDDVKWNNHVTNLTNGAYFMNPANIYNKVQVPSW